ncbi:MAG: TetR/AcrR family transcriptional regulator [Sphingomonadaceae bacterium]
MAIDWGDEGEAQGSDRQAERRKSTRRRILEAAVQVFAERGYHDSSVDDIVRASGTSKGAVYFHFPNKQGIFLALVEFLAGRLIDGMDAAIASERGGIAKVEAALRTVLEAFATHRSLARILLIEVVGLGRGMDPTLFALRARLTEAIKRHLDRAVADGSIPPQDTETAARVWLGAINEVVTRWLYEPEGAETLEQRLPPLRALLLRSVGYQVDGGSGETRGRGDGEMRGSPFSLGEGLGGGSDAAHPFLKADC